MKAPMAVYCPTCHARPGEPCRGAYSPTLLGFHAVRVANATPSTTRADDRDA